MYLTIGINITKFNLNLYLFIEIQQAEVYVAFFLTIHQTSTRNY
jgi:hypothetical protein